MRGKSGRVVLEIDPAIKRRLYSRLAAEGQTLKDWFISRVEQYLTEEEGIQLRLKPLKVPRRSSEKSESA
jgi:hypothetical protein